jgi:hypothetical protein
VSVIFGSNIIVLHTDFNLAQSAISTKLQRLQPCQVAHALMYALWRLHIIHRQQSS